ncbi:HNH endonuclease [Paenibacillus sp. ClWae2A]|uniref:AP2 domain-containing protein n=1 Tax=Paenibacillus sp. ClWae2A TaxID=3057177 RepID=UPI0028F58ADA|nr:HNH endonuclease [Paenibacillus sp. ClWae2A]MDT9719147.1 HNH endonuclease [Paenibacillus sp. ClWae2A]
MKNKFLNHGEYIEVFITRKNGDVHSFFVSVQDYARVNSFTGTWYLNESKQGRFYVHGNLPRNKSNSKSVQLHRWILDPPSDMCVDHINHDTLDNRRSNLRIATKAQNSQNREGAPDDNTSGLKGVSWHKRDKRWRAFIGINRKYKHLGYFNSKEEAAAAYNRAASFYFGEFAVLNAV